MNKKIKHEKFVGIIASVLQLVLVFVGYSDQIIRLLKAESLVGVSVILFVLVFISHSFWLIYAWSRRDYPVLIPQIPGVLLAFSIVIIIAMK